jgi:hypothetical protein
MGLIIIRTDRDLPTLSYFPGLVISPRTRSTGLARRSERLPRVIVGSWVRHDKKLYSMSKGRRGALTSHRLLKAHRVTMRGGLRDHQRRQLKRCRHASGESGSRGGLQKCHRPAHTRHKIQVDGGGTIVVASLVACTHGNDVHRPYLERHRAALRGDG